MPLNNTELDHGNTYTTVTLKGKKELNIHISSDNRLGKVLDPSYIKVIDYPYLGKFSSVKSLSHWLIGVYSGKIKEDDIVRKLVAGKLTNYVRKQKLYGHIVPNYKAIIGYATWLKLKEYPELVKQLKKMESDTDVVSYSIESSTGLRIPTSHSNVLSQVVRLMKSTLESVGEPDFSSLTPSIDHKQLLYTQPFLCKIRSKEEIEKLKQQSLVL